MPDTHYLARPCSTTLLLFCTDTFQPSRCESCCLTPWLCWLLRAGRPDPSESRVRERMAGASVPGTVQMWGVGGGRQEALGAITYKRLSASDGPKFYCHWGRIQKAWRWVFFPSKVQTPDWVRLVVKWSDTAITFCSRVNLISHVCGFSGSIWQQAWQPRKETSQKSCLHRPGRRRSRCVPKRHPDGLL